MMTFPAFKPVDFNARAELEAYVKRFPHYSTWNFTALWAWNARARSSFSMLNGNLVLLLEDDDTSSPFLTFLGTHRLDHTARTLLDFASANNVPSGLRIVPAAVAELLLSSSAFQVQEDPTNHDYIFSASAIAALADVRMRSKAARARQFASAHPVSNFQHSRILSLSSESIRDLCERWEASRPERDQKRRADAEAVAFHRIIQERRHFSLLFSSLTVDDTLVALSIEEPLDHGRVMAHFVRADRTCTGIYEYFNQRVARALTASGLEHWNWHQDHGHLGLREAKLAYRPATMLKSYTVTALK